MFEGFLNAPPTSLSWTELRHSGLAELAALAPTLAAIFVGQINAIFSGRHTF